MFSDYSVLKALARDLVYSVSASKWLDITTRASRGHAQTLYLEGQPCEQDWPPNLAVRACDDSPI